MIALRRCAVIGVGVVATVAPGLAHHGQPVQYDPSDMTEIKGIVRSIEWQPPHAGFTLAVPDGDGTVRTWEFELAGTGNPLRRNWLKNSLRIGDAVSVKAFKARDGSPSGNAVGITTADGRPLFAGSPGVYAPRRSAEPTAGASQPD